MESEVLLIVSAFVTHKLYRKRSHLDCIHIRENSSFYALRMHTSVYEYIFKPVWENHFLDSYATSKLNTKPALGMFVILNTRMKYEFSTIPLQFVFDYRPGEVFACDADLGWITGHSYVVYGPLCNGGTTVLFGSKATYPHPGKSIYVIIKIL